MGRLSLDNRFAQHPKFDGWTVREKWAWLEVMLYCARYETAGRIPIDKSLLPRSCTEALLDRAEKAGWIERDPQGQRVVHDFEFYNGPKADKAARQARWRANQRPGDVDVPVDAAVDANVDNGASTAAPTRARDRGRGSSRSNPPYPPYEGGRNAPPKPKTPDDVWRAAINWVNSPAFDAETMSESEAAEELGIVERRCRVEVSVAQREHILQLAREKHDAAIASWEGDEP